MYGLDKAGNFRFLVGVELLQISIGLYQLALNFTEGVCISSECLLRLVDSSGSIIEVSSDEPNLSNKLVCLLGAVIEDVVIKSDKELILIFSGGRRLEVLDSNETEESFTITTPDQEVIV